MVDTRLALMPASSAASGLSAAARMAMPWGVRVRNSDSIATTAGTTASTTKCFPEKMRSPKDASRSMGDGKRPWLVSSGRMTWAKNRSCEAPMVATSSTSRGARKSRRTIVSSMAPPRTAPRSNATTRAAKKFQWRSSTSLASTAAHSAPSSPKAKLTTPVAR
jgi:hypothetical protein